MRRRRRHPYRVRKRNGPLYHEVRPETLNQLAQDMAKGLIFTDRHLHKDEAPWLVSLIFMPLIFLPNQLRRRLSRYPPGLIYEYYSEAFPRGVNGYPIFGSIRLLSPEQTRQLFEKVEKIEAAVKAALE